MLLNRRIRTIPNMFVASLALSDLLIGVLGAGPLALPVLVTSSDPFNDTFCQFQGEITRLNYHHMNKEYKHLNRKNSQS